MKIGEYKKVDLYCGNSSRYNMRVEAYIPIKCYVDIKYKRITNNLYHCSFSDTRDNNTGDIYLTAQDVMSLFFNRYKSFKIKQFTEIHNGGYPDGGHIYNEISCYFERR